MNTTQENIDQLIDKKLRPYPYEIARSLGELIMDYKEKAAENEKMLTDVERK